MDSMSEQAAQAQEQVAECICSSFKQLFPWEPGGNEDDSQDPLDL